jgi:hypothetical protein
MTVTVSSDGQIKLQGACTVEDAEALLQELLTAPTAPVDWSACESAHSAVVQVLLVAKIIPVGTPLSAFLRDRVQSALL